MTCRSSSRSGPRRELARTGGRPGRPAVQRRPRKCAGPRLIPASVRGTTVDATNEAERARVVRGVHGRLGLVLAVRPVGGARPRARARRLRRPRRGRGRVPPRPLAAQLDDVRDHQPPRAGDAGLHAAAQRRPARPRQRAPGLGARRVHDARRRAGRPRAPARPRARLLRRVQEPRPDRQPRRRVRDRHARRHHVPRAPRLPRPVRERGAVPARDKLVRRRRRRSARSTATTTSCSRQGRARAAATASRCRRRAAAGARCRTTCRCRGPARTTPRRGPSWPTTTASAGCCAGAGRTSSTCTGSTCAGRASWISGCATGSSNPFNLQLVGAGGRRIACACGDFGLAEHPAEAQARPLLRGGPGAERRERALHISRLTRTITKTTCS